MGISTISDVIRIFISSLIVNINNRTWLVLMPTNTIWKIYRTKLVILHLCDYPCLILSQTQPQLVCFTHFACINAVQAITQGHSKKTDKNLWLSTKKVIFIFFLSSLEDENKNTDVLYLVIFFCKQNSNLNSCWRTVYHVMKLFYGLSLKAQLQQNFFC